ncbi:mini-chromosome maintenance complex-binding protein [Plakobranchus ocellatus]|uniref:Mini-chromosome maintenance complex-binding protein n=1 Tax=Plakobranchus ocellatus TaxID=259542 RepID=A0AAV3Z3T5_9GAST|nr:mini-chromosome maintenance complex-binding protein [Plakobranchus ocellatus]
MPHNCRAFSSSHILPTQSLCHTTAEPFPHPTFSLPNPYATQLPSLFLTPHSPYTSPCNAPAAPFFLPEISNSLKTKRCLNIHALIWSILIDITFLLVSRDFGVIVFSMASLL